MILSNYKYTDTEKKKILDSITILIDSREQENAHIIGYFDSKKRPYKVMKLDFADYSFMLPKNELLNIDRDLYFDTDILIERKSNLDELAGNLSTDRARLEKEFSLMPKNKALLIETGSYEDLITGKYRSEYNSKAFLATLESFRIRYGLEYFLLNNQAYSGMFIYYRFYYYLREGLR